MSRVECQDGHDMIGSMHAIVQACGAKGRERYDTI